MLNRIAKALEEEDAPSFLIDDLFPLVFGRFDSESGRWTLTDPKSWTLYELKRALEFVERIATEYARIFYDPHAIPVTHYKRQKKIAIHLDQQFARCLREAASRSGAFSWMGPDELSERDHFLDEPILFLKQEMRKKGFPRVKKGGGPSRGAVRERYESKLRSRGVKPLVDEERWMPPGP